MVYGFDENTARQLVRLLYETRHQMNSLQGKVNRLAGAAAPRTTQYVIPKTTLEPGQTCEAYLAKYNSASGQLVANTRDTVTVKDLNSWAFAVGTDDYASSVHRLPVARHPLARCWIVTSPTGLIQQAKPDSTIATGGSGTFSIYQDGIDTTVNVSSVNVTWGDNGEGVTSGKESWIRWHGSKWEWIGGDCET